MPTYGMGEAIREMRIRCGYTQEELAFGICTTSTLSRIENGRAVTSRQVFEALMDRMPGMHHVWISVETENEMHRSRLCKQILLYLEQRRMDEARMAMEEYRKIKDADNPFCEQFALYSRAIYQAVLKGNRDESLTLLYEALGKTKLNYSDLFRQRRRHILLTYDEIFILSNIGIAYGEKKETERAYQILHYLKCYSEQHNFDLAEGARVYPMILGNFAWILERQGRFEEAAKQCDAGINVCLSTGKYTILPHLLCIKAWCLAASGNQRTAKNSRMKAKIILDMTRNYGIYGSFQEFYKAREPIYVMF